MMFIRGSLLVASIRKSMLYFYKILLLFFGHLLKERVSLNGKSSLGSPELGSPKLVMIF